MQYSSKNTVEKMLTPIYRNDAHRIHIYVYIYVPTDTHIHVFSYIALSKNGCIYVYIQTHTSNACMLAHIHSHQSNHVPDNAAYTSMMAYVCRISWPKNACHPGHRYRETCSPWESLGVSDVHTERYLHY
jgi:hypothetical protein